MNKKKIRIKFVDFWPTFHPTKNFIYQILEKKYDIEVSEQPDYLFFSCFGNEFLKYDCIRIFYTGENLRPDFNVCDYAIGFDFIEFEDRYIRFPQFMLDEYQVEMDIIRSREIGKHNNTLQKDRFCNYIYSNSFTSCPREHFFHELSKYKKVDSGGKHLNNIDEKIENKLEWQQKYKFSIAFENSSTNGYTTEKIFQAFAADTIPIYWGNPLVHKDFNEKAFINCHSFNNFEEVIRKIEEVDTNQDMYQKMLNEPVFSEYARNSYLKQDYLELFLSNIIDKDYEKAKKIRHEYTWTQRNERIVINSAKFNNLALRYSKLGIIKKAILRLLLGKNWLNGKTNEK